MRPQLASAGYLIGAAGITFPGEIANGVSFASCNSEGVYAAWSKIPSEGKLQILFLIGILEWAQARARAAACMQEAAHDVAQHAGCTRASLVRP